MPIISSCRVELSDGLNQTTALIEVEKVSYLILQIIGSFASFDLLFRWPCPETCLHHVGTKVECDTGDQIQTS